MALVLAGSNATDREVVAEDAGPVSAADLILKDSGAVVLGLVLSFPIRIGARSWLRRFEEVPRRVSSPARVSRTRSLAGGGARSGTSCG
jgi:hypothetical protein